LQTKGEQYIREYENIAGVSSKDLQHQGEIKETTNISAIIKDKNLVA
jgi:hypothetical protein